MKGNIKKGVGIIQESALLSAPLDVLALIMSYATPRGNTFATNTNLVCRRFHQATDIVRFTQYKNKPLKQASLEKKESEAEACIVRQQDEIEYLLKNETTILRITQNSLGLIACFKKLKDSASIKDVARRFLTREDILYRLNREIIEFKLQRLQLEKSFGVLDFGSCCLTRFPGKIISDPKYKLIFDSLVELRLNNNYLLSLPPEIGQCTILRTLVLSNNRIQSLPPEVKKLTQLIILSVYNNHLNSLPSEVGELTALQTFLVDNNKLEDLPPQIGKLANLEKLDLSKNKLKILPEEIGDLRFLRNLFIHNNELHSLPQKFNQLTSLEKLGLNNNYLESLPENLIGIFFDSNNELITKEQALASQSPELPGRNKCI